MRVSLFGVLHYLVYNSLDVFQDIVIPKSHYLESLTFQPSRSLFVFKTRRGFIVLAAINFDDQFGIKTNEINDILPDGLPATEFYAAIFSQFAPEEVFSRREISPQHFGYEDLAVLGSAQDPLTLILSHGGERKLTTDLRGLNTPHP